MASDYVLDCSALVEVLVGTDETARELQRRVRGMRLHAPYLLEAEVGQVLRRQVRAGVVDAVIAHGFLRGVRHMLVERYPHDALIDVAWDLRDTVSFYDALYVALAARLDLPLLTSDRKLANAPGLPCAIEPASPC